MSNSRACSLYLCNNQYIVMILASQNSYSTHIVGWALGCPARWCHSVMFKFITLLLAPWHWLVLRCLDRSLGSRLGELWTEEGAWASCFKVRKGPSSLPPPLGACCLPPLGHTKRKQQAQRRCLFPLTQIPVLWERRRERAASALVVATT